MSTTADPGTAPTARSALRTVALPTEHGGWGLTLEPVLLGLLVAPSIAGAALGLAALLAFLARTPLRFALVDHRRGRRLARTRVAERLAVVEVTAIVALVALAAAGAEAAFWPPVLVAAPLVAVEVWFDARSRSRRLAPELAGAVGISAIATMIALAGGADPGLAWGLWLVLAARAVTAIPYVRDRVRRLHGGDGTPGLLWATDLAALLIAGGAVVVDPALAGGAAAVVGVVVVQRVTARRQVPRAVVLGIRQLALGLAVVAATAIGVGLA